MSKIVTKQPDIRIRWVNNLFEVNDNGKYGVCLLIDKGNTKRIKQLKDAADAAGKEFFGSKYEAMKKNSQFRFPIRDGDEINPKREEPYNPGYMFINASSGSPVEIVSRYRDVHNPDPAQRNKPRLITEKSEIWDGEFAKVNIVFKGYKNEGFGVACYINGIQVWHEGDRMAGAAESAQDTFDGEDIEDDEFSDADDDSGNSIDDDFSDDDGGFF